MSTITIKRPPRKEGPAAPQGKVDLQEPPVMAEPATPDFSAMLMYLPMGIGSIAMILMFSVARGGSPIMYVMGGAMGTAMICMSLNQLIRPGVERKRKMLSERRDYLRYIAQIREQAREASDEQRQAVAWNNPDPAWLWSLITTNRLWERRGNHEDFARVRIGLGTQSASLEFVPPTTKPIEDLEPLSSVSLRRFSETYRSVNGIPISVGLRSFTSVELVGDLADATGAARAIIGQLATFHAPDELLIAVLTPEAHLPEWDWVKWLPHNAHPEATDSAGPLRLLAAEHDTLLELLGSSVTDRGEHDKSARASVTEPLVVVVAHLAAIPESSPLLGSGLRNVVLLDVTGAMRGGARVLRLTARGETIEYPTAGDTERAQRDDMSLVTAENLARIMAPRRTSGRIEVADAPLERNFELTTLLGIRDPYTFDVAATWRQRTLQRARMSVPIGVTSDGEVMELDLKESAQGGSGPHGMLIGATGSGKSELLRTLVCGLAATHSSEILNLVLVDFKGGATFLGMEKLPHTSAVITNLADELPLVDRMQDALNGELNRRQEILRESGHPSLYAYEQARLGGEQLTPLPTLLIIVDEFSELLASKSEFMELFVSIGRLGRSLGVHLLLASQRLDEGRIHRVEGHLSYRVGLRTFSSMESRAVIGVANAYELPSEPGNGFLRLDTSNLVRFKGAYVSGPWASAAPEGAASVGESSETQDVVPFAANPFPVVQTPAATPEENTELETDQGKDQEKLPSLAEVLIDRLRGAGPPARQVWLPPLSESPALDTLLPGVLPDPVCGMTVSDPAVRGRLRIPIGLIDRPFDQSRDLMMANLGGADGHVGVVGAPQAGKSTLLRTLILSLALTHTPREVQFYGLDLGGGGIMSISGLPHVGSVATRMERDRVVRTIEELTQIMERRESAFAELGIESMDDYRQRIARREISDPHGDVFLVIDGWFSLRQDYSELETKINELASRGLSFGIHVMVAASRWSEIRPWLRDLLGTRYELRLGDPMESDVGSRKAATVPNQPGRGVIGGGFHFLTALPRLDGASDTTELASATKSITDEIRAFWPGAPAPPVRLLPTQLPAVDLPPVDGHPVRMCLGLDEQRLQPVWHDFGVTPHLMVFGDNETGKTNALRLVLNAVRRRYPAGAAKVLLGDSRRDLDTEVSEQLRIGYAITPDSLAELAGKAAVSLGKRVPGQDVSPDRLRLRDWWDGPELFVVVDDYELFARDFGQGAALEPLLPLLAHGVHVGLHLVIARSASGAMRAMVDPLLRRLWELGTPGLVLSYPSEEGKFLGEAKPRKLTAGRAQLVTRRGVSLVQTGLAPTEATVDQNAQAVGGVR